MIAVMALFSIHRQLRPHCGECPTHRNRRSPAWRNMAGSAKTTPHTALSGEGSHGQVQEQFADRRH
ncbi:MAG TPA: hypothetical protein VN731_09525, partial [Rhodanobacter sp.]|nr:hypothetical protein [Rhodanobacter sp.]